MYSQDLVQKITELRLLGLSRKTIASQTGLSPSKIKYILQANQVYLTKDQLVSNLKAAQTDDVQERKRASSLETYKNNPEIAKARNISIKKAWSNPEILQKQSERSKRQWEDPVYAELVSEKVTEALSKPEAKAKLSAAHKDKISPNNAEYAFSDIYKVCEKYGMKFLNQQDPGKMLFKSRNENNEWPIECECGNILYPDISILARIEVPKSCGCKRAIAEGNVRDYVKTLSGHILDKETKEIIPPFGIDICDPVNKVAIEYCGLHWHSAEFKKRGYHYNKYLMCKQVGYRLITLFEDEWLIRQPQVQGFLRAIFDKKSLIKKDARKLKLEIATKEEARVFTDLNHIQVYTGCPVNYKLTEIGEIVALASFSKRLSSRQPEEGTWELHRYTVKIGFNVRGGLGKMIGCFKTEQTPKKLVTYSDNRWSNGNLYKAVGFSESIHSEPSYWHIKKNCGTKRFHKSLFKKERIASMFPEVYSKDKTELEMMKELGYEIIWDCGKVKWTLIF